MLACGKQLFFQGTSGGRTILPFQKQQNNKVAVIEEAALEKRIKTFQIHFIQEKERLH